MTKPTVSKHWKKPVGRRHQAWIPPEPIHHVTTSLPKVIWEEGRVAELSHIYAVKSPLVTMAPPNSPPKVPITVDWSPNHTICLIPKPVRPTMRNGIRIRFAVFHNALDRQRDRQTERPTDRPRESLMTIGRCAPTATRPNNTTIGNRLYAQRNGPNMTNPICWTCKNCSHKCAAGCEHCVTQSSTQLFW